MSNSPAHRPSLADRVGMAIFSVAGLGIVVTAAVAAGYRIVGVLQGVALPVRVQPVDLELDAPIGPGGSAVPMQIETATVIASPIPQSAVGIEILSQAIRFGTIATVTICLVLLTVRIFRGHIFGRSNTGLATTAGLVGITGSATAVALNGAVGGSVLHALGPNGSGFIFLTADPAPLVLGGFALAVALTAFTVGAKLQRDTEGLI